MITTFVLALREFLEAFLIIGIFLGVSQKFKLKKNKEILFASITGIFISLLLPALAFLFGEKAKMVLTEKNADLLEGYLLIFSGIFIAYVVFSLHKFMAPKRHKDISQAKEKLMEKNIFDLSLFLTIIFFIIREGFEITLLTATTSLFSKFAENISGLLLGFFGAGIIAAGTFFSYIKIPVNKVFQYTEYVIILFGAAMVKNGITSLAGNYFHLSLGRIFPVPLNFLPTENTLAGHLLKNIAGLEKNFSLLMLSIMLMYIGCMYFLFLRSKKTEHR